MHGDMATKHGSIGHDHVIADVAIMRHVTARHEVAVATNTGRAHVFDGASIDGDSLSQDVVITNDHGCRFVPITNILGFATNHTPRMKDVVASDRGVPANGHVGNKPRARLNFNMGSYVAERTNFHRIRDDRGGVDDGARRDALTHGILRFHSVLGLDFLSGQGTSRVDNLSF